MSTFYIKATTKAEAKRYLREEIGVYLHIVACFEISSGMWQVEVEE